MLEDFVHVIVALIPLQKYAKFVRNFYTEIFSVSNLYTNANKNSIDL